MEALESRKLPNRRDLRWFGVIVGLFFGILGGVFWLAGAVAAPRALWGVGVGLAVLYYALPPLRLPLYLVWMRGVRPIGWVVSHLALGLIFYGLITPLGTIMRLFGRDALLMRRDASRDSYWTSHDPSGDTDRYFRQT